MISLLVAAAAAASTYPALHLPPAQQRALLVEHLRADVRAADPLADTASFEQALAVIGDLPREEFVQREGRPLAYLDVPQLIGHDQTISNPHTVAIMTAALELRPGARVLDVGTGSGYQAAVLARLGATVYSIEIVDSLATAAAERLRRLRIGDVTVRSGDGYLGWPDRAPFDGIVVAAGASKVPQPLIDQLKVGGRLVMPIGPSWTSEQILVLTKQADGSVTRCSLGPAMFVPLTGMGRTPELPALADRGTPLCFGAPVT